MSHETELRRFLDRRMADAEIQAFTRHLDGCNDCRGEIQRWHDVEQRVVAWAEGNVPSHDAARAARSLMTRSREAATPKTARWPWVFGLSLASAAAAVALVVVRTPEIATTQEVPVLVSVLDGASSAAQPQELAAPSDHRLLIGIERDRIGVAAKSKLVVAHATSQRTELKLESGKAAFSVFPRNGKRQPFLIDAGKHRVSVVGTRFLVDREPTPGVALTVSVEEGTVRVESAGLSTSVTVGERLEVRDNGELQRVSMAPGDAELMGSLLREPGTPEPPTAHSGLGTAPSAPTAAAEEPEAAVVEEEEELAPSPRRGAAKLRARAAGAPTAQLARWKKLVLAGDYKAAESELVAYLGKSSKDPEAWLLLGDARRKDGRADAAVQAYRRVIGLGDAAAANQARFLAAVLLQDQLARPREALGLLRTYLTQGEGFRPLESAAMLRSGKALLSLGQKDEARRVLTSLVREHADTPAGKEATKLLSEL